MTGRWLAPFVPDPQDTILAVHAALVRTAEAPNTGSIVFFSGADYRKGEHDAKRVDRTRIFDCARRTVRRLGSPVDTSLPLEPPDLFCCGHALLGDGRLVVVGGTHIWAVPAGGGLHHDHWPGLDTTFVFDPISLSWIEADRMPPPPDAGSYTGGRWYPTAVTLRDGAVVAMSGHPDIGDARHNNNSPGVFRASSPRGSQWRVFPLPSPTFELGEEESGDREDREYPRAHVLPGGVVFCSTPLAPASSPFATQMQILDPNTGARAFVGLSPATGPTGRTPVLDGAEEIYRSYFGTSVLLPLLPERDHRARVLLFGGRQAWIVDLKPVSDAVRQGAARWNEEHLGSLTRAERAPRRTLMGVNNTPPIRRHVNAVILPTGEVFFTGGIDPRPGLAPGDNPDADRDAVLSAEIYGPVRRGEVESDSWGWSVVDAATAGVEVVPRNYHSVALLMPDGRVWCAGSSKDHGEIHEPRMQIFEPWYIGETRPLIDSSPRVIHYDRTFLVRVRSDHATMHLALLRCGTATHGFDGDQRYVGVHFDVAGDSTLKAVAPPRDVAPPGTYLLYAIDDRGVPSEGKFVLLWDAWYHAGVPTTPAKADVTAGVTAVWNDPRDHLDLFFVGDDGSVVSTFWEASKGWVPWFAISPPGTAARGQTVAALRNGPNHLDAFVIRGDGTVLSSFWEPGTSWVPWFAISPPETAAPDGSVAALRNGPNHLDAFVIRGDGTVLSSFWEPGTSWVPWFAISPRETAAPGQTLEALWNGASHLDVFVVRGDGTVLSSFWQPSTSWVPWFAISPRKTAGPNQSVTARWSKSTHLDVFVTRDDGTVLSSFWEPGTSWVPWFAISPPLTAMPGNRIVALWSSEHHLDVFVTRADGAIMSSFWEFAAGWVPWFAIDPPPGTTITGKALSATWRDRDHLDLFAVGGDGRVWGIWWEAFVSGW